MNKLQTLTLFDCYVYILQVGGELCFNFKINNARGLPQIIQKVKTDLFYLFLIQTY